MVMVGYGTYDIRPRRGGQRRDSRAKYADALDVLQPLTKTTQRRSNRTLTMLLGISGSGPLDMKGPVIGSNGKTFEELGLLDEKATSCDCAPI